MLVGRPAGRPCGSRPSTPTGCCPCASPEQAFPTAYAFRRFLQKNLRPHLAELPAPDPCSGRRLAPAPTLPRAIIDRWPAARPGLLAGATSAAGCRSTTRCRRAPWRAGPWRRRRGWRAFLQGGLARYGEERNHPDEDAASGLSPYLHFGHVSAHEVSELLAHEGWSADRLAGARHRAARGLVGRRRGGRGVPRPARHLARARLQLLRGTGADYDRYESLPEWARATLGQARARPAAAPLRRSTTLGGGGDARPAVERRAAPARARGPHAQLPADAVGQEDPRVVGHARGGAGGHDRAEQPTTRSTAATRTPTAASSGASAATTGRGARSGRSSAPSAT